LITRYKSDGFEFVSVPVMMRDPAVSYQPSASRWGIMHFKSILVSAVTFTISFIPFTVASPASEPCTLPQDLQREVSARYPKAKVVSLVDLEEDDRKFFKADHHDNCPGLVKVDFYGDGKPTLAFILIMQGTQKITCNSWSHTWWGIHGKRPI